MLCGSADKDDKMEMVPPLEDLASKALAMQTTQTPTKQLQDPGTSDMTPANSGNDRDVRASNECASVKGIDTGVDSSVTAERKLEAESERPPEAVLGKYVTLCKFIVVCYSSSCINRPGFRQQRGRGFKEDPYVFLDKDSDVYRAVQ